MKQDKFLSPASSDRHLPSTAIAQYQETPYLGSMETGSGADTSGCGGMAVGNKANGGGVVRERY